MLKDKINDYTRKELCKQVKIEPRTLNNWENYKTANIFKYLTLCEILKINPFDELENYRKYRQKNSIDK